MKKEPRGSAKRTNRLANNNNNQKKGASKQQHGQSSSKKKEIERALVRDHLQFHAWGSAAERTHCRKWETVYIAYTYYKSRTRTIQVKRYYTSPYRGAQKRQTTTRIYITTFVVGYRAGSQPADVVVFLIKNQLVETSLFSLSLLVLCVCRKSPFYFLSSRRPKSESYRRHRVPPSADKNKKKKKKWCLL